ncbi:dienelactone hydrolase family protein [Saccharothrix longispora]|uniref:Dienelactone hydrolase n=1 Tax=Saccharothrix longispora TaxID=33920 RepID=A0ABU1PT33_9PSEU|nr:dienelactone hydrolase family protein [Saccharothrix longispora]MDR6593813.1 dienelactone hydrolase [Saccharothrix longispora]
MRIHAADGPFDVPLWEPATGHGPGLVLVQEIFGLDDHLRSVAAGLAALGYVVAVPELFRRTAPGWVGEHDDAGVAAAGCASGAGAPACWASASAARSPTKPLSPTGPTRSCRSTALASRTGSASCTG